MTSSYYNEVDPYAAQWLRNLIREGHIAPGDVDERSIVDVRPDDLGGYSQCHFFAGIGGWSVALKLADWPDDRPVWTGSCPCQPFSAAGKGKAADDERHLWPTWFSLIAQCRPATILGEQVEAAVGWGWLDAVFNDLEKEGYACGAAVLPAVGAPHIRQRLWFVADAQCRTAERWRHDLAGTPDRTQGEAWQWERLRDDDRDGSTTRILADADGRDARSARLQRGGQQRQQQENGGVGELADGDGSRRRAGRSGETGGGTDAPRLEPSGLCDAGELGRADQPGPQGFEQCGNGAGQRSAGTTGLAFWSDFWSDLEWLACTDGKARPVEPAIRSMADGISRAMGRLRAHQNLKEEIINAATGAGLGPEIMCALQSGVRPQEIWQSLGGCLGFSAATLLLAGMCQYSRELGNIFNGTASAIGQDQERSLRELRQDASMPSRPPCRWQLSQQCRGKLADALSELSSQNPCLRETLESLAGFTGNPLAHGIRNRASQLRAYGNAIVPQTAAQFIRAVM